MFSRKAPSTRKVRFKVGDIVRPNPQWWSDPHNLKQICVVAEVVGNSLRVTSDETGMMGLWWNIKDFIHADEFIIDKVLTKYS